MIFAFMIKVHVHVYWHKSIILRVIKIPGLTQNIFIFMSDNFPWSRHILTCLMDSQKLGNFMTHLIIILIYIIYRVCIQSSVCFTDTDTAIHTLHLMPFSIHVTYFLCGFTGVYSAHFFEHMSLSNHRCNLLLWSFKLIFKGKTMPTSVPLVLCED